MTTLPVIDFGGYGLNIKDEIKGNSDTLKTLGKEFKDVFTTVGFCYLKNHGINLELVNTFKQVSLGFFENSDEEKSKYCSSTLLSGYIPTNIQSLNLERPGDLRESFGYCPSDIGPELWPPIPDLQQTTIQLYTECKTLTHRICDVLSVGLGLPIHFFRDAHKLIGQKGNPTNIRSLYYPPILPGTATKAGQLRSGEHSDFGTLTLVFQDEIGGLEVLVPKTGYVPAKPISGTVIVFLGDMMSRWTSDTLIAKKHRVVIPEDEVRRIQGKQSVVFFVHTDGKYIIKCLDGSDTYAPICSDDYAVYQMKQSLGQKSQ